MQELIEAEKERVRAGTGDKWLRRQVERFKVQANDLVQRVHSYCSLVRLLIGKFEEGFVVTKCSKQDDVAQCSAAA